MIRSRRTRLALGAAAMLVASPTAGCHEGDERDPCSGVTCSVHGECSVVGGNRAQCECDEGFVASGLECVASAVDGDGDVDGDADSDVDADGDGDADSDVGGDGAADADGPACDPISAIWAVALPAEGATAEVDLVLCPAIVTYVATDFEGNRVGFFAQSEPGGPGVRVQPPEGGIPAVVERGAEVTFRATAIGNLAGSRVVEAYESVAVVSAANPVDPLVQDLGEAGRIPEADHEAEVVRIADGYLEVREGRGTFTVRYGTGVTLRARVTATLYAGLEVGCTATIEAPVAAYVGGYEVTSFRVEDFHDLTCP